MELASQSIVVTANQFNPGAVSQLMLVNTGVISGIAIRPVSAQVSCRSLRNILIEALPDRVQVTFQERPRRFNCGSTIRTAKSALPHSPYTAIGMNLMWHSKFLEASKMESCCRTLFCSQDDPMAKYFKDGEPRAGTYHSKYIFGVRLKLTVLPSKKGNPFREFLNSTFNFHLDLSSPDAVKQIETALAQWPRAKSLSAEITKGLEDALSVMRRLSATFQVLFSSDLKRTSPCLHRCQMAALIQGAP